MNFKVLVLLVLLSAFSGVLFAQQVSGVVLDSEMKEPLIGASVTMVDNSEIGVSTDIDGNFEFKIPRKHRKFPLKIEFGFIGYDSKTISVSEEDLNLKHTVELTTNVTETEVVKVSCPTYHDPPGCPSMQILKVEIVTLPPDINDEAHLLWFLRQQHIIL